MFNHNNYGGSSPRDTVTKELNEGLRTFKERSEMTPSFKAAIVAGIRKNIQRARDIMPHLMITTEDITDWQNDPEIEQKCNAMLA